MAEAPQELRIHLAPGVPPHPITYATICIVNRIGQTIFFDFGAVDPLTLGNLLPGTSLEAAHVGRIAMAEDVARQLRDHLNRVLGER